MKNIFIETRKVTNIFQMYSKLTFKETIGKLTRYKHAENMFGEMRIKRNKPSLLCERNKEKKNRNMKKVSRSK